MCMQILKNMFFNTVLKNAKISLPPSVSILKSYCNFVVHGNYNVISVTGLHIYCPTCKMNESTTYCYLAPQYSLKND